MYSCLQHGLTTNIMNVIILIFSSTEQGCESLEPVAEEQCFSK